MERIYALVLLSIYSILFSQSNNNFVIKDQLGNDSRTYSCSNPFTSPLTLTANAPTLRTTSGYSVSKVSTYTPIAPINSGQPLNISNNSEFFTKVDIGFPFCFYNNNYSQLEVGKYGLVSFDPNYAKQKVFPEFIQQNPDVKLPLNSIFGVFQAMYFDNNSQVYAQTVGTAPNRKFIINFYNTAYIYDGSKPDCEKRTSSQIVLFEGSNEILVYIKDRPLPCEDSGFKPALVGIQNAEGTQGVSPPGRNTGIWEAADEAWLFSPNGATITPQVTWYDKSGKIIGNGPSLNINSVSGLGNIRAEAKYSSCGPAYTASDTFEITNDPNYPAGQNYTGTLCSAGNVNLMNYVANLGVNNPSNFNFRFFKTLSEAESGSGTAYTTDNITGSLKYYVRIENKTDPGCFIILELKLDRISTALKKNTVDICEALKDNYSLSQLNSIILDPGYSGTVSYFSDSTGSSNITNINLTNGTKIWLKLEGCPNVIGPVTINLIPGPALTPIPPFEASFCDFDADGGEPFDYNKEFDARIVLNPSLYKIQYFGSYNDASKNINPLSQIREGIYKIYVRVEPKAGGCFSIMEIELKITFNRIQATDNDIYLCFDGTQNRSIGDLTTYITGMNGSNTGSVSFHNSVSDANLGINPISSIELNEDGAFTTEIVYVRFQSGTCFTVRELRFHQINLRNYANSKIKICDAKNDGTETVTLSNYNNVIAQTQPVTIKYFADSSHGTPILTKDITKTSSNKVYFEMVSTYPLFGGGNCTYSSELDFELGSGPEINTAPIIVNRTNVCDNNNNGFELFDITSKNSEINPKNLSVTYSYYASYNESTGTFSNPISLIDGKYIKVTNSPVTVYVKVKDEDGIGCETKSEIRISYTFNPDAIKLHPAILENCSINNIITFNLTGATEQQFVPSENRVALSDIEITYYEDFNPDTYALSNPISSPYTTGHSDQVIYAKYTSKITGCFSVEKITLKTYLSPIARKNREEPICKYSGIDLRTLENGDLMAGGFDASATYQYTYYLSNPETNPSAATIDASKRFYPDHNQKIWFRIKIKFNQDNGCTTYGSLILKHTSPLALNNPGPFVDDKTCDIGNDGIETVTTLRQFESLIKQQYPNATFSYYESFPDKAINPDSFKFDSSKLQKVVMLVSDGTSCPAGVEIQIKLNKTPVFSFKNDTFYFCANGGSVLIEPETDYINSNNLKPVKFQWSLPDGSTVETSEAKYITNITGKYKLTITADSGCSHTESFTVKTYEIPQITRLITEGKKVTVIASIPDKSQKVVYRYDGQSGWQESNVFLNMPAGVHTFYVKYEDDSAQHGCPDLPKKTIVLDENNAITPNGDGMNDKWIVKNLDIFEGQNSNLKIFDRQNKLLYDQTSSTELSWDGYFDHRVLPTATYWYVLTLPDGRQMTGWILLKNY